MLSFSLLLFSLLGWWMEKTASFVRSVGATGYYCADVSCPTPPRCHESSPPPPPSLSPSVALESHPCTLRLLFLSFLGRYSGTFVAGGGGRRGGGGRDRKEEGKERLLLIFPPLLPRPPCHLPSPPPFSCLRCFSCFSLRPVLVSGLHWKPFPLPPRLTVHFRSTTLSPLSLPSSQHASKQNKPGW